MQRWEWWVQVREVRLFEEEHLQPCCRSGVSAS
jgi:hypothetical protein